MSVAGAIQSEEITDFLFFPTRNFYYWEWGCHHFACSYVELPLYGLFPDTASCDIHSKDYYSLSALLENGTFEKYF